MKPYPSTRTFCRSSMILSILLVALALVLTFSLIQPSPAQRQISSEEAADFVGYFGTVCGSISDVRAEDSKHGIVLLFFGNTKESPEFEALITPHIQDAGKNYEGKRVCIAGRILNEWGGPRGVPSIRVTDDSQITIE